MFCRGPGQGQHRVGFDESEYDNAILVQIGLGTAANTNRWVGLSLRGRSVPAPDLDLPLPVLNQIAQVFTTGPTAPTEYLDAVGLVEFEHQIPPVGHAVCGQVRRAIQVTVVE